MAKKAKKRADANPSPGEPIVPDSDVEQFGGATGTTPFESAGHATLHGEPMGGFNLAEDAVQHELEQDYIERDHGVGSAGWTPYDDLTGEGWAPPGNYNEGWEPADGQGLHEPESEQPERRLPPEKPGT